MYERPQYLTGDGFRRCATNPSKKAALAKQAAAKANERSLETIRTNKGPATAGRPISKKAARLIAMAIRDMLRQK